MSRENGGNLNPILALPKRLLDISQETLLTKISNAVLQTQTHCKCQVLTFTEPKGCYKVDGIPLSPVSMGAKDTKRGSTATVDI